MCLSSCSPPPSKTTSILPRTLTLSIIRYADAARLGDTFQSSGDVDVITIYIALVADDVADMNANAVLDALVWRNQRALLIHVALHFYSTTGRVDHAGKFNQDAIPGPPSLASELVILSAAKPYSVPTHP